ncbi:MAG: ParB/RepB/Spo0J family partition protein [Firmicutes bacterium]|nr:ParB/RepB/Spo0J family partition protein [Bacillota bacterium]
MWRIARGSEQQGEVFQVALDKIRFGRFQPRFQIEEADLADLVASIREVGVLQPVLVRPCGAGYELIAGERRVRASMLAGLKQIPAVVRELSDAQATEVALIENIQRRSLHFFEEAEGYAKLIREFRLTQAEVARRMGLSQSTVANKLRLLRLDPEIRLQIYQQKLSERHARALLELPDKELQQKVLSLAAAREFSVSEWEKLIRLEKDRIISREIKKRKKCRVKPLIRDLRLFLNSLERGVETLRAAGLEVHLHHHKEEHILRIMIEVVASGSQG